MLPQVKYIMGLKIPRFDRLQDTCSSLVANLNYFNWREYVVSRPRRRRLSRLCASCTDVCLGGVMSRALNSIACAAQMGMSFIIILEVFKYIGRKHKCELLPTLAPLLRI